MHKAKKQICKPKISIFSEGIIHINHLISYHQCSHNVAHNKAANLKFSSIPMGPLYNGLSLRLHRLQPAETFMCVTNCKGRVSNNYILRHCKL